MVVRLRQIFPNVEVIEEYRHPDLRYSTNRLMELDAFIPSMGIAFEYQGQMHYHSSSHFGDSSKRKRADEEKKLACQKHGILLVEVHSHFFSLKAFYTSYLFINTTFI